MKHEGNFIAENHSLAYFESLTTIGGYADFMNSNITDLGKLTTIGGGAYFGDSQITDLGKLTSIGGRAYFRNSKITILGKRHAVTNIDGYPMIDIKWKERDGIEFSKANYIKGELSNPPSCYVARIGDHTAHGETLAEAIEDAQFKALESADSAIIISEIKQTGVVTLNQWRALTGACRAGTASHLGLSVSGLPESMVLSDAIEKSAGTSFGDRFKSMIEGAEK